jgi:hypothetical protein
MPDKKDIIEKTKKVYEVLPKLNDRRCGYKTCGEFARAVAEGKTPCYGCVSGGAEVAAKVCEIIGAKVPERAIPAFVPRPGFQRPGFHRPGLRRGIGVARGLRRRPGRGPGMGPGGGIGRAGGRGRGFRRGRGGR